MIVDILNTGTMRNIKIVVAEKLLIPVTLKWIGIHTNPVLFGAGDEATPDEGIIFLKDTLRSQFSWSLTWW